MNIFTFIGSILQIFINVAEKTGKGVENYADAFANTGDMAKNATQAMCLEQRQKILKDFDFDDNGNLTVKKTESE